MYNAKTYIVYAGAQKLSGSNYLMRLMPSGCPNLPSLGVVLAQSLAEVLVPACVDTLGVFLAHVDLVRVLLQVRDIVCSMSSLENGIRGL